MQDQRIMNNKYTLPPINLWNFWIYNKFIREYDDKTIYKEWIDAKIKEIMDN